MYENLLSQIENNKKILITSHISPDPDSIGSALYLYNVLKRNIPNSEVKVCIEGQLPISFSFLNGFNEITNTLLLDCVLDFKPDILIMLDGNNLKRFAKSEDHALQLENEIKAQKIHTVIIDHHMEDGKYNSDIFINNKCSSTAEEVYNIFTKTFSWKTDKLDKEATLFGIIGDTGRFLYKNEKYRETFAVVSDLLDSGISIEELQGRMSQLSTQHIKVISELMKNLSQEGDYNYSYLTDDFVNKLKEDSITQDIYNSAYHHFMDQYIRNTLPNKWGFVLIPDINFPNGIYKGSFRAVNDLLDTTVFAKQLEGGGHKPASGFKVRAASITEALDVVRKTISINLALAYENK